MKRHRDYNPEHEHEKSMKYQISCRYWLMCNRFATNSLPHTLPLGPARMIGKMIKQEQLDIQYFLNVYVPIRVIYSFTIQEKCDEKKQLLLQQFAKNHCDSNLKEIEFEDGHLKETHIDYFVDSEQLNCKEFFNDIKNKVPTNLHVNSTGSDLFICRNENQMPDTSISCDVDEINNDGITGVVRTEFGDEEDDIEYQGILKGALKIVKISRHRYDKKHGVVLVYWIRC